MTRVHVVALALSLVPVMAFAFMMANLVLRSLPAFNEYGLSVLLSTKFSNIYSGRYIPGEYGLLPALWGSLMLAVLAQAFAFPASLAIAVFASEFSMKGVGRLMELAISVFAGIPAIIYSLLSIFILTSFIRPKLTGQGFPEDYLISLLGKTTLFTQGVPADKSTLLGGIMLALLIIPFMTPLMLDAIRNVPEGLKEASLGLGATRWHTLVRITLPSALPGILAAVNLGLLMTIGDVIISAWVVGFTRTGMPAPLADVFESVAPLTSTGAGLISGLQPGAASHTPNLQDSVAFFAALLLVALAFLIQLGIHALQSLSSRRIRYER